MSMSNRSAEVRKEARAKLLRMREARLSRRSGGKSQNSGTEIGVPDTRDETIEDAISDERNADMVTEDATTHEDDTPSEAEVAVGLVEDDSAMSGADVSDALAEVDDVTSDEDCEGRSVPVVAAAENTADPKTSTVSDETDGATVTAPKLDFSVPELAPSDTDLNTIPGAGPGLVWMLSQASIRSLEDLAVANPETLKSAFGPVGQILDIDELIAFARDAAPTAVDQAD